MSTTQDPRPLEGTWEEIVARRGSELAGRRVRVIVLPDKPPARETVEVSRLPKDVNVEISCIAVK